MITNTALILIIVSCLLVLISILLTLFSRYKHTQFKKHLMSFLNVTLFVQLIFSVYNLMSYQGGNSNNLIFSYTCVLLTQILCNVFCYMSLKRRIAKVKSTLDSFSME